MCKNIQSPDFRTPVRPWGNLRHLWVLALALSGCSLPVQPSGAAEPAESATKMGQTVIEPLNHTQFFLRPDEKQTLTWRVPADAQNFTCEVRDYQNNLVSSPRGKMENGRLALELQLPAGFYEVTLQPGGQRFGIVSAVPHAGAPDKFFAIDAALSWLETRSDVRPELIALLKRSGIGLVRERLSWGAVNPEPEKWDWETNRQFDTLRREYSRQGVQLLELFHAAPGWTGSGAANPYPQQLAGTKNSWRSIAKHWQGTWDSLEVWNEPDIATGGELPADQYLPVVKAISYGFQQDGNKSPVGGGVFGYYNPGFIQNSVRNGLLNQVDFVSFHTYAKAPAMEQIISDYRRALTDKQVTVPLWLTESGQPWKNGPARPELAEDTASALDISMKAVESRACGIARYFAFVYPYYPEGERNFGMMGREITPLRSMAAYVQTVSELSGTNYVGDLALKGAPIQRARVFAKGENAVVVLYAENATAETSVPWSGPIQSVTGIDGRIVKRLPKGAIPLSDGLAYVHTSLRSLKASLQRQTPAARLTALAKSARPVRPAVSAIVTQPLLPTSAQPTKRGYKVAESAVGEFPFRVRVNNLAGAARQVNLLCTVNGTTRLETRPLNLAAEATGEVQWNVDLARALQQTSAESVTLEVTGAEQGGPAVSPLSVELFCERDLEANLRLYPGSTKLAVTDLARWKPNITSTGQMKMNVDAEQNWQLQTNFKSGDRWVYPDFRLPDNLSLTASDGLVLRARALAPSVVRVMVKERSGATYFTPFSVVPADGEWHSVVLHWQDLAALPSAPPDANSQLDLDQIQSISIGMNSRADENTLEISGLYVARRKQPQVALRP